MAEVLVRFTQPVKGEDNDLYVGQACGGPNEQGLWEGWIEFTSETTGKVFRSGRETTQPNRTDVSYWAQGLTEVYLEGALSRALSRALGTQVTASASDAPIPSNFSGPAAGRPLTTGAGAQAVLDPINTYTQGEQLLHKQLSALSRDNLVTIIKSYQLELPVGFESFTDSRLVDEMVAAVKQRVGG